MENSTNADGPNVNPTPTLNWNLATRRDNPEYEVYATAIPEHLQEYTANLLSVDVADCEIVTAPRHDSARLQGMSRTQFHETYACPGIPAPEHPLVPKAWHGLGYRPLTRDQLPETGTHAYFRGMRDGDPIDDFGYPIQSQGVVLISGEAVHVGCLQHPRDAIFAWRPIPPCDWETNQ